jgi:hypothetical protein
MISPRIATLALVFAACIAGAAALGARGQSTARPGEPTQAHVWVDNRTQAEAVPVTVQNWPAPVNVHLDASSVVQAVAGRQKWEYRLMPLASGPDPARGLTAAGDEGWEAVGVLQPSAAGATVLLKRPR